MFHLKPIGENMVNSEVTLTMYEIYNEVVRDLLQPEGGSRAGPGEIAVTARNWVHVKVCSKVLNTTVLLYSVV